MTLGSLFDGSGTAPMSAEMLGINPLWASEIEPSDTAEYKMWGNGMALPCALYVLQGIKRCLNDA